RKQTSSTSLMDDSSNTNALSLLTPPLTPRLSPFTIPQSSPSSAHPAPIGSLSISDQESWILEDLLHVLLGMDGLYIKKKPSQSTSTPPSVTSRTSTNPFTVPSPAIPTPTPFPQQEYTIDSTLDPSLTSLITRILPLARDYLTITEYIDIHSRFEYGQVCHALTSTLRTFLKDYTQLVAQLEHQIRFSPGFGCQKCWYHVGPSARILEVVRDLVKAVKEAEACFWREEPEVGGFGGVLLGVLADGVLTMSGDKTAHKIYSHVLHTAAVPYLNTLRMWIHQGQIQDPFNDFLVQERASASKSSMTRDYNDGYWEVRYTVRANGVPCFLEGVKEKVLLAGKYLNVVGECGVDVEAKRAAQGEEEGKSSGKKEEVVGVAAFGEVVRVVEEGRFVEDIEKAYRFANQQLLELLMDGNHLVARLRSLKHYLLLDQSDFLTHFLDLAYPSELAKPRSEVSKDTLTSMLELVLRNPGSVSYSDPYKDDVTVELSSMSLVDQLLRVTSVVGVEYRDVVVEGLDGSTFVDMSRVNLSSATSGFDAGDLDGELRGIDAFTLGYNATFPVSLIINKRVVTKYQLLFRHLLHCKNVERMLTSVWAEKAKFLRRRRWVGEKAKRAAAAPQVPAKGVGMKRHGSIQSLSDVKSSAPQRVFIPAPPEVADLKEETAFLSRVSIVQGRMLMFVQQFLHFCCFDVVEPNWILFERELNKVTTVEEVLKIHNDFLDTCLKDCLLTNQRLLKHFGNLMTVCTEFSQFANAFLLERFGALSPADDDEDGLPPPPPTTQFVDLGQSSQASQTLKQFEDRQVSSMREFIHALQFAESVNAFDAATAAAGGSFTTTAVLQDLVTRIDFNLFYSRVFVSGIAGVGGVVGVNGGFGMKNAGMAGSEVGSAAVY
ncbi:Gamma-tubulin complex component 2, partial [Rhizoclosmatium sp. JEL0117]